MKRLLLVSLSICLMLNTLSSFAWGPMGHDVVAAIAEQNLSKKARKAIDNTATSNIAIILFVFFICFSSKVI